MPSYIVNSLCIICSDAATENVITFNREQNDKIYNGRRARKKEGSAKKQSVYKT